MTQLFCYRMEIYGRGSTRYIYTTSHTIEEAVTIVQKTLDWQERINEVKYLGKATV